MGATVCCQMDDFNKSFMVFQFVIVIFFGTPFQRVARNTIGNKCSAAQHVCQKKRDSAS